MQEFKIDNFDTFILDLDSTVWLGIEPTFWAKKLKFPIKKERQRVYLKGTRTRRCTCPIIRQRQFKERQKVYPQGSESKW